MDAENMFCVTSLHGGHLTGLCIWPLPELSVTAWKFQLLHWPHAAHINLSKITFLFILDFTPENTS